MPQPHVREHDGLPVHPEQKPPLWVVERQEKNSRFVPGQDPIVEYTVYFRTRSGTLGWVTLPANQYNAQNVADAISPEAERMEAVQGLHAHPVR